MNHHMLRFPEGWEWHLLSRNRTDADLPDCKKMFPLCADWLDASEERLTDHISVTELPGGEAAVHGTLMIPLSDDEQDVGPFHFWLSAQRLVTNQQDMRFSLRLQLAPWEDKLERSGSAPEAFTVMLSCALESFHDGLDAFEKRLESLEESMRLRHRADQMELIFSRRYELLHWSHHYIAVKELEAALKEAFMGSLTESEGYRKLVYKLQRIETLIMHYGAEIDTLISMDDAVYALRGNDIMRTLTFFITLVAPAAVAGTLWGTNFRRIPWAAEPWGFAVPGGIVLAITFFIYLWLRRRGVTGAALHTRQEERRQRSAKAAARKRRTRSSKDAQSGSTASASLIPSSGGESLPRRSSRGTTPH
ncbi:magnesium transporter [Paenibacillus darwinianus]|uniref:Magnesium transporter n=1 Tax=Paenibacillus darwinianus TaxID=1380763 RepID=A0A9W5S0P0_9BACL|nr:CorA family divalent cation transporter [Paenibacillus darwinianus]EXX85152.1 magnesium transporter [Paenibacillus darwinianus]EXX86781.1 magnesium transporter [Paenibacillus darwinianus]EXX86795.1 magnesium transporter [Paenibacillus darwinianus]